MGCVVAAAAAAAAGARGVGLRGGEGAGVCGGGGSNSDSVRSSCRGGAWRSGGHLAAVWSATLVPAARSINHQLAQAGQAGQMWEQGLRQRRAGEDGGRQGAGWRKARGATARCRRA